MTIDHVRPARRALRLCAALALTLLVAACGGGGGSGGDSGPALTLSLSPTSVKASFYQGTAYSFSETATVTGSVSGNVVVVIQDNGGSIQPSVDLRQQSDGTYLATFTTSTSLSAGTHNSTIDVRLCPDVSCSQIYGKATLPYSFTVVPTPSLTSINPNSATAGGPAFTLTATGTGFSNSSTVRWNGSTRSTSFVSSTQLTAQITAADIASGGTASVDVINSDYNGATSSTQSFTILNPAPALASISPQSANVGSPAFTLTVNGSQFVSSSTVLWNGSARTTSFVSATQLTAQITSADVANGGTSSVTVSSPTPGGGTSSAATFSTLYPAPSLKLLNANTAQAGCAAFSIAVVGSNIGPYSTVLWNGSPRQTTQILSTVLQAQLTAADIASAQTATVTISNPTPGGGTSAGASFSVTNGTAAATTTAPSYLVNPQHTNIAATACPVSLPTQPTWTYDLGAEASYSVIAAGKVFTVNRSGSLFAFDQLTGAISWGPVATAAAGPAYDANAVYVVGDGPCCSSGFLKAYSAATGGLTFSGTLASQYSFSSAATAVNGTVYTDGAGSGGTLYAVNGSNGNTIWTASVANGNASTPAVTSDGVYTVFPCQTYDNNPVTGASVWHYNGPCEGGGGATPTVANGVLYSPPVTGGSGTLFNAKTGAMAGSYVADVPPALTAQYGYFVQSGQLSQIRQSDNVVTWTFPGDSNLVTAPILVNQTVFVGSGGGTLYALDAATGTLLWTNTVGGLGPSQKYPYGYGPAMTVGSGVLVVPTGNSIKAFTISSSH